MTFGPPPFYEPQKPPPRRSTDIAVIVIASLGISTLFAGLFLVFSDKSTDDTPAPAVASSISAEPTISIEPEASETPSTDMDRMTELVVDIAWGEMSQTDQDDMCTSIDVLGTEWAADAMRGDHPDPDEDIDWDQAAEIIEGKCAERGY